MLGLLPATIGNANIHCFQFQSHNEVFSIVFLELIFYAVWSFGLVYIACEMSQRFCDALNEMDDDIGQLDWYLYPAEIQRLLLIIVENSQQPVIVKCFGSIACSRETLKKSIGKLRTKLLNIK